MVASPDDAIWRAQQKNWRAVVDIDERTAEEIYKERMRGLSMYTGPSAAYELSRSFSAAQSLTTACHTEGQICLGIFTASALLLRYRPFLYVLAAADADSTAARDPVPREDENAERRRAISRQVLRAICRQRTRSPDDVSLEDIVDQEFGHEGTTEKSLATAQASVLFTCHLQLLSSLEMAHAAGLLALSVRYILYRALLQDYGSGLEKEAHQEESAELLKKATLAVAAKLSVVGEIAELAEFLYRVGKHSLLSKQASIDRADRSGRLNVINRDYIAMYLDSLSEWKAKASAINEKLMGVIDQTTQQMTKTMTQAQSTYAEFLPSADKVS